MDEQKNTQPTKLKNNSSRRLKSPFKSRKQSIIFVLIFAAIGGYLLFHSFASGFFVASEAESGTVSSPATIVSDTTASGGKAILFNKASACTGVNMTSPTDVSNNPSGTTFCISGTHNWSFTPKSGDTFIGDGTAILDGAHTTLAAIIGGGTSNVTLTNIEVRNYTANPNASYHAAIPAHGTTGWKFNNLQVHDNGVTGSGGTGAELGVSSVVTGGRYYNNRHLGIGGGGGANGWIIDGAEIDHNNFTDDNYTTRDVSCGWEGGGVKWTAQNITVKNAIVHDNACKGLWADINANGGTITNNRVYNNWDEGIFIEISSYYKISGNTVYGNGFKNLNNSPTSGCSGYLWAGGITDSSSDHVDVFSNNVYGNCNGITGVDQSRTDRTDGVSPSIIQYFTVHDNTIAGPGGKTGVVGGGSQDPSRNNTFTNNTILNGMNYCQLSC